MSHLFTIVASALAGAAWLAAPASQETAPAVESTLSPKPFGDAMRTVEENAIEFAQLNNWLVERIDGLEEEQLRPVREAVYSVIDSHVKLEHARTGSVPSSADLLLDGCLDWAERLGCLGIPAVRQRLGESPTRSTNGPEGFSFSVDEPTGLMKLESDWGGFSVRYPYHFMVSNASDAMTLAGVRGQNVTISTGFGRHLEGDGWSQATIMIVCSRDAETAPFVDMWVDLLRIEPTPSLAEGLEGRAFAGRWEESDMRVEALAIDHEPGVVVAIYMGLPGTFEYNRPHFLDVVRLLRLESR